MTDIGFLGLSLAFSGFPWLAPGLLWACRGLFLKNPFLLSAAAMNRYHLWCRSGMIFLEAHFPRIHRSQPARVE
jgi:hypothetical protein